ncbi:CRISPR-associated helicase/endonuclease Cas3 [Pseudobacillus badius]|uniref:CRISPR-associated helicase/endonuclease Cas3 n=1 Tax=Bacillus badius TaxID=1455 RepID=UPI0007B0A898|nr:CRISPR-associated helicase/endonuclease Cas3 [Bacillus badius]KZO00171.1 CRISPR-associated helicase/endonuclease Cas3 [Bacillus badius]OCS86333.1 CRISPR-associated helicase/endonuclease Cas3 [Bacillus badius]OVE52206.1 CRISPR-associated helicase/endonuclease Cas3 [Bacillus badius]TDW03921.1 CRISPR-associated Cas3 family helicase [Bacillus badius]
MEYIAHIRASDGCIQSIETHLLEVKELAERYGEKLGMPHLAGLAGMLHDAGKYTCKFTEYILAAVSNPDAPPKRGSVDHSTAGGKLLYELFHTGKQLSPIKGILAEIVGNAIISHHSYLQDFLSPALESDYLRRVRDKELTEFSQVKQVFFEKVMSESSFHVYVDKATVELESFLAKEAPANREKQLMLLTKFIFSVLIDADRTNTRLFEEKKKSEAVISPQKLFPVYYDRLAAKLRSFDEQGTVDTPVNRLRKEMSECCENYASKPPGIYTLSIPTGGGKTLASLRYALKHAEQYGKKRIVYVLPYTTIIEQNAAEVRNILQDPAHILEHHSNVVEEGKDADENEDGTASLQQKLKLAKDNWDAPIIFTTMVQFLNAFYADGSRNVRRLHNLCESVIIFDEVQKVPVPCVSLFNQAVNFLKARGRSTIVLCTATQPALGFVKNKLDINTDGEMIAHLDEVIGAFKRVDVIDKATDRPLNNEELAGFIEAKIKEVPSVLVILNTKSVVKDLYERLKEQGHGVPVYHLSTSMCAAHRKEMLSEIRSTLKEGKKIICVSTQLIEAGVDISFQCVIRSLAGLDSIAQAAGRCNRHGEKAVQPVYVIDHAEENLNRLKEIKAGKQIARRILIDLKRDSSAYDGDLLSRKAMERYFKEYYTEFESDLNYFIPQLQKEMTELLADGKRDSSYHKAYLSKHRSHLPLFLVHSYGTAAKHFRVIDDWTTPVIVPYGSEGKELITQLNGRQSIEDLTVLLRKAQQYTVNLSSYEKEQLIKNDGLVSYLEGKLLALKEGAYNDEYGLDIQNESGFGEAIY